MSTGLLARATELRSLPVVTIDEGEDIAEVKDVVYDPGAGHIVGFTLNKRGFLRGPMKQTLAWSELAAVGRDAVMVDIDDRLDEKGAGEVVGAIAAHRNVIGNDVLTDAGRLLGTVDDLVVDLTDGSVVGYQLAGDTTLQGHAGGPMLVPLPATLAVNGTNLLVPDAVEPFVRNDLAGFGAAVDSFRAQLAGDGGEAG